MSTDEELRIEYVPLDEVERWPRNPKLHDEDVIDKSIDRFGYVQPLTKDEVTGRLVAGHGRLTVLAKKHAAGESPPKRIKVREDGMWLVPVVRGVSFASEREAEAYVVADNRAVELGGWDEKLLADILRDMQGAQVALDGVGWGAKEVDRLLTDVSGQRHIAETSADQAETYMEGDIKQIVLYFSGEEFPSILQRLQQVLQSKQFESHTQVFRFLLEHYESAAASAQPAA